MQSHTANRQSALSAALANIKLDARIAALDAQFSKVITRYGVTPKASSQEAERVAYILKGAPVGHVLCSACEGYGDADFDDYDGRPISRVCSPCDGEGHVMSDDMELAS
jgi:DnaJ-class molecular chaperone